jgi:hypothetical protein
MSQALGHAAVNTNANDFEELASSLASLASLMRGGDMGAPIAELERLYERALRQPPCYRDVNEMTGQSLNANDRRCGRGAWLLLNVAWLRVTSVHSLLWHEVAKVYRSPLLDQAARALGAGSRLSEGDLQRLGGDASVLDVLGVRGDEVWLVQTMWQRRLMDSAATDRPHGFTNLFKTRIFRDPVFGGEPLETLGKAEFVFRQAFPGHAVRAFCLVMHPEGPDFELYEVRIPKTVPEKMRLTAGMLVKSSLEYEEQIKKDHESLWMLPDRLDDELFRGLPPCRAGRTLCTLASLAWRQLASEKLLLWKERRFIERLEEDFGYDTPRDKVRHDLVDRLAAQGFIRKWESFYHLTTRGLARYLYCLAKYTTKATHGPIGVVDECIKQRDRIIARCGFA